MKNPFPGLIGFIGAWLLKLIYGPAYGDRWYSPLYTAVRAVEAVLSVCTVLWVLVLVLLLTDAVPLHAALYLALYPAALALWSLLVRRKYK